MVFLYFFYISLINIFFGKFVKIINSSNKKGYIKENRYFTMNLNERGITVGDLLIVLIIILTTTTIIKSLNKDKKTTLYINNQDVVSQNKNSLSNK